MKRLLIHQGAIAVAVVLLLLVSLGVLYILNGAQRTYVANHLQTSLTSIVSLIRSMEEDQVAQAARRSPTVRNWPGWAATCWSRRILPPIKPPPKPRCWSGWTPWSAPAVLPATF